MGVLRASLGKLTVKYEKVFWYRYLAKKLTVKRYFRQKSLVFRYFEFLHHPPPPDKDPIHFDKSHFLSIGILVQIWYFYNGLEIYLYMDINNFDNMHRKKMLLVFHAG